MKLKILIVVLVVVALIAGGFLLQHWKSITSEEEYSAAVVQTSADIPNDPVILPTSHKPENHKEFYAE